MATFREIATLAGVSPSTVSRVINGNVPVRENARNRVLHAMKKLELQSLKESAHTSSRNVGIIMPAVSASNLPRHPSLYSTVLSFIEGLSSYNIGNTTIVLDENDNSITDVFKNRYMSAYLILGTSEEQESLLLKYLSEKKVPFLFINRLLDDKHASSVNIDDEQATEIAVNHLIELGHRKIAFIGGNSNYKNTKRRFSSYVKTLQRNGLEVNTDYIFYGDFSEFTGYDMGKKILTLSERPTAACAASDSIAIGFINCMKDHGYSIPDDFSVIGFGNIEACEYIVPHLTTISQNAREMGHVAATALIQMMDNPVICRQQILINTELIVRNSCKKIASQ